MLKSRTTSQSWISRLLICVALSRGVNLLSVLISLVTLVGLVWLLLILVLLSLWFWKVCECSQDLFEIEVLADIIRHDCDGSLTPQADGIRGNKKCQSCGSLMLAGRVNDGTWRVLFALRSMRM